MKFLNAHITQLNDKFYAGMDYVKLYPIDAEVGDCVYNKENRMYDCKCNTNYQISVDSGVYATAQYILNGGKFEAEELGFPDFFATTLFFLKFLPRAAPLYIAYLFNIYKMNDLPNFWYETYPYSPFVPPNVDGKVEEIKLFRPIHDQLFQRIFELAALQEWVMRTFAFMFDIYKP